MLGMRFHLLLAPLLALLLIGTGLSRIATAAPPLSVTLNYFRGESGAEGAHLSWQTATELDTAGFRLSRASDAGGPFQELGEIGFIEAQGGPVSGDTYEALDTTVVSGQTYWYRLIEIEQNSDEHVLDTTELTIGNEPTATLDAVATSDDGDDDGNEGDTQPGTGNPTATGTPSPSPSPDATNPAPTNTPRPATATPTVSRQASPTPDQDGDGAEEARPVGDAVEAAAPTTNGQPTAVAQVTEAYPEPPSADATPEEGYPGGPPEEDFEATPVLTETTETEESYPAAPANETTPSGPAGAGDNVVGSAPEADEGTENQTQQSGNISRVLLWLGFVAALIIFIAGAVFSILLSTRKQRQDIS
ncbi:MAG: hypothetical protein ACOC9E_01875 [Chloroflexota bacterium]